MFQEFTSTTSHVQKSRDKRRIILAKIEIPIEFFPDGSHVNHNDRACVNFYRCPLLPPQQNYDDVDYGEILEDLLSSPEGIFQELADDENPIFIMKEPEIHLDVEESPESLLIEDEEQEEEEEEEEEQDNNPTEYHILKSEIPSKPRPASKNSSFKRNPSRGKRGITYKMRRYGSLTPPSGVTA